MMKAIKKRLLAMSIALAIVLPSITLADKPNFPSPQEICTMSDSKTPPFDDSLDTPTGP